jgi:hypothetical protein
LNLAIVLTLWRRSLRLNRSAQSAA